MTEKPSVTERVKWLVENGHTAACAGQEDIAKRMKQAKLFSEKTKLCAIVKTLPLLYARAEKYRTIH